MANIPQVGRLALRHEGQMWNAYYALPDTMEGALLIGAIAMAAVEGNGERKQAFMDLMRDFVGDILAGATGVKPEWNGPQAAPEHERAGHS